MPYAEGQGDSQDLRLSAENQSLITKAKESGAPVITVLISGRPLVLDSALDRSDAVVAAWLPGTEGEGVADVLFGDYKPTGKLPRAWPLNNEQVAATTQRGKPLFPFGFGLSYSSLSTKSATANIEGAPTGE
jgi:beta-glucosidase